MIHLLRKTVFLMLTFGISFYAYADASDTTSSLVVETQSGKVQGSIMDTVISYKGIPYAAPPVGENRWREPQPAKHWDGVKKTIAYANDCMQKPFPSDAAPLGEKPAEDCLYMNIWIPAAKKAEEKLPVMLWIYGGGYVNGGSSPAVYDGSEFAKSGVILVSFNYRLGRFGFFAHPALSAAKEGPLANYGYMDQIAALKWVHDNIEAFGGDKNKVTIFGESAGGASVYNLLQTSSARGLFRAAIVMSGGGRSLLRGGSLNQDTADKPSAETVGMNFAQANGITGTGPEALAALRALSAEKVLDGLSMIDLFRPRPGKPTFVRGPVKDGEIVLGNTAQLLAEGDVAQVAFMAGTTSQDLGFSRVRSKDELFQTFGQDADQARHLYDPQGTAPLREVGMQVAQDRGMQEPARYAVKMYRKMDQAAYLYRFGYVAESIRDGKSGAQHASEIPFVFNTVEAKYGAALTENDRAAAKAAHAYFVNFAKYGNPNGKDLPTWKEYDSKENNILIFTMDKGPESETDPRAERLDLVEKHAAQ